MSQYLGIIIYLILFLRLLFFFPQFGYADSATNETISKVQQRLVVLGYNPGPVDGIWGKKTQAAILKFQIDQQIPTTGRIDNTTKSHLGFLETTKSTNHDISQISPSETLGVCFESEYFFKEYKKNERQFNERFNDIPICISGSSDSLGESNDYFYINFSENNIDFTDAQKNLNIQCRIKKINDIHRKILKQSLDIKVGKRIQVKGIYQVPTDSHEQKLLLTQCYLVEIADI